MSQLQAFGGGEIFDVSLSVYPDGAPLVVFDRAAPIDRLLLRQRDLGGFMAAMFFVDALAARGYRVPDLILPLPLGPARSEHPRRRRADHRNLSPDNANAGDGDEPMRRAWERLLVALGWPRSVAPLPPPRLPGQGFHSLYESTTVTTEDVDGTTTTRTERNGRIVTCGACLQKNAVYFDRQGLRLCGGCGLPLTRVRFRGGR